MKLALLLALGLIAAQAVDARGIDRRQWNQSARIEAGYAIGALSAREALRLDARQDRIAHREWHYRADGYLGPWERVDLHRRLNRSSAAIWRQAHDGNRW